jgi:murein DD-endopeptidase MepM/ murein hydrolase activator NlpD
MKVKMKKVKLGFILVLAIIIIAPLSWFLFNRLEGQKPDAAFEDTSAFVGKSQELTVSVSDTKSGIRKLWISLVKDGKENTLLDESFPSAGLFGTGEIREKRITLRVEPDTLGLSDGDAILRMAVWDYSWRGWFKGNQSYVEKNITIDTRAPEIEIYSLAHNVNQGGSGLVIYRLSETCPLSGVNVGDKFFEGYTGGFEDRQIAMAFFALGYKQGKGTKITVSATDQAGNSIKTGMNHYIRRKVFKKDTINISDKFLNWKIPEFKLEMPGATLAEKFLTVNRDQRQADYKKISELVKTPDRVLHWEGPFLRLPKSAPRARFADHRKYKYKGKVIDQQVHLGVDLASLKRSPIPAANNGVVVFADRLGIYGRTILLDHGFGLFSMYAHLNQIAVKAGQKVSRGDILGKTGSTGLAGGDHLHFSILIHDTFVNPIEWWDRSWIKNNVTSKIDQVRQ